MKDTIETSMEQLNNAFFEAEDIITKKYLSDISLFPVKKITSDLNETNLNSIFRINHVEKIVFDSEENNLDKLINVYNAVALCGGTVIYIIDSDGKKVNLYLGTRCENQNDISTCQAGLVGTFNGNFPGSKIIQQPKNELNELINKIFPSEEKQLRRIISIVNGVPSLRNDSKKTFVQGMEKLIDSMIGKKYTLMTIAEPVGYINLTKIKESYEMIYSQLSPFAKITRSYSESDTNSIANGITDSISESIGNSVTNSRNVTYGVSSSSSYSRSQSVSKNSSLTPSIFVLSSSIGKSKGTSEQNGVSHGQTEQKGNGYSVSESKNNTTSQSKSNTETYSNTRGETNQLSFENKRITDLLKTIDKQIVRIDNSKETGLWNAATYCIADDAQTSKILASTIQSLCRGKKDSVENPVINTLVDAQNIKSASEYLKKMTHPVFKVITNNTVRELPSTSLITGDELVICAGLPQKSVSGLAISKMSSFSRNIVVDNDDMSDDQIELGSIYHMGREENTKALIDVESLSSHVLITGSTGSGKSNTVYKIISEMIRKNKKFLVVEPAKGEYKNIFGNLDNVHVYGTNRNYSDLLRINPFSFPENIHVLEHIDRLVEIFNICWPMYAAMPAVLKDSILRSYRKCGWDLDLSENVFGKRYFPTFKDVQKQIVTVIEESSYSEEVKSNYIGSLATRIKSLTNGINGTMFVSNEIDSRTLFDENVIVDLSRVGAQETKSLIMGFLVLKLNEYRMSNSEGLMNQSLQHITVLEEAHNLLRNPANMTSSSEEGNISNKSVEMLSNSIAEMRSYGEGFIIVDQSPGAIDISAIRNTNTKIIMRLPEDSDRQSVGKAAAMTEIQIPELAKLSRGVAVVYQNNWLEPVLCKIHKTDITEGYYRYSPIKTDVHTNSLVTGMISMLLVGNRVSECLNIDEEIIKNNLYRFNLSTENKIKIEQTIESLENDKEPYIYRDEYFSELADLVSEIINYDSFKYMIDKINDEEEFQFQVNKILSQNIGKLSEEVMLAITQCILRQMVNQSKEKLDLYSRWREYAVNLRKKE